MRIQGLPLIVALIVGPPAFSQEDPNTPMTAGKSGYMNLSIGVLQDEKMDELPNQIELKGTFRAFTSVQWNPKTRTMRFSPTSKGVGTLVIRDPKTQAILAEYHIDVRKTDLQKVAREIQYLLRSVEGVQVKILNNKVVVDGETLVTADMKRVHSVVKLYGEQAVSLVVVNPNATTKVARIIEREIANPEIRVNAVNGRFILAGFANSREDRDRAEVIARMFVPDVVVDEAEADRKVIGRKIEVVVNLITIRPPPESEPNKIVQLVVHYVELTRDQSKSFRFQWMPDISDGSGLVFKTGEPGSTGGLTTS
ncbi:MAG: BON domain-containing protein, partial [Bdellovibrionales bacterium]